MVEELGSRNPSMPKILNALLCRSALSAWAERLCETDRRITHISRCLSTLCWSSSLIIVEVEKILSALSAIQPSPLNEPLILIGIHLMVDHELQLTQIDKLTNRGGCGGLI